MTEQEYINKINLIREKISQGNLSNIQYELDEIYLLKPVRLLWFVAEAEYYFSVGQKEKIWPFLNDKFVRMGNYPGMEEIRNFHLKWAVHHNDKLQKLQLERYYNKVLYNNDAIDNEDEIEAFAKRNEIGNYSYNLLTDLCSVLITYSRYLEYFIILQYLIEKKAVERNDNIPLYSTQNYGYLLEQLQDKDRLFVFTANEKNKNLANVLSYILYQLGHPVYIVAEDECNIISNIESTDSILHKSISGSYHTNYAVCIPALYYYNQEGLIENNIDYVLEYIYRNYAEDEFAVLISNSETTLNLLQYSILKKNMEALVNIDINISKNMCFSWLGNYLGYLKSIYKEDVADSINQPDQCEFSIVVPARNSAGTLQYTLQTCLNQNFQGEYEIIVSDNSQEGYNEVKIICDDINDHRIKYYRTPRDLQLTKSYEYAYLKAKGTFILSIGSDDGLYSDALSTLHEIINTYPKEFIIQWKRGFYAWPGFNGGQENELVILKKSKDYSIKLKRSLDYFAEVLSNTQNIYDLPLLYINSGFRRSYIKELLMKTGRLWDGCNQDVSIGIINITINKSILNIDCPITIAGMSGGSMGYRSVTQEKALFNTDSEVIKKLNSNAGIYCSNSYENLIPQGKDDACSLYRNILRNIRLGLISEEWLTNLLDFKKIFKEFFSNCSFSNINYDKYLHNARHLAEKRGTEFLNWFNLEIYHKSVIPKYIPEDIKSITKKTYKEGETKEGNLIVDASTYNVNNIMDAVLLSEKIYKETSSIEKKQGE